MNKREVASILKEIAFFIRLSGGNPYKARAYERAGMAVLTCPYAPLELLRPGTLTQVDGIGPATASVIAELLTTGTSAVHQKVRGTFPSSLAELGDVPGLSMKQIVQLYRHGGVTSLAELQVACRKGALLVIPGIGPKMQAKLLTILGEYQRGMGYHLYADLLQEADHLEQSVRFASGCTSGHACRSHASETGSDQRIPVCGQL